MQDGEYIHLFSLMKYAKVSFNESQMITGLYGIAYKK